MADQIFLFQALGIEVNMKTDITGATYHKILYTKPDYTQGEWAASIDGTATRLTYDIPNGVLDQLGQWQLQGKIVLGSGEKYDSGIVTILIEKPLDV